MKYLRRIGAAVAAVAAVVALSVAWAPLAGALTPGQRAVVLGGLPNWVRALGVQAGVLPTQTCRFTTNECWTSGGKTTAAAALTVSRASAETCDDTSGNWIQVTNNVPCITNKGLGVWESRTNSIRNNSMVGGSAPSTLPTNWTGGTIATVVPTYTYGSANGVDYIDITYNGTPNATTSGNVSFDTATQIAATYGQTWAGSVFQGLSAGSVANATFSLRTFETTSGGAFISTIQSTSFVPVSTLTRTSGAGTSVSSTTAFLRPNIQIGVTNGQPINFTLRIGWPQLENNSINSTFASAAIQAAGSGGTNGTAVYSVGGGTCPTPPTLNITIAGGVLSVINSVANAGNCSVFPPSPAALTYVSGTGTGLTGATVNLTPTNNAALAFASPPIITTSAAATRAANTPALTKTPIIGAAFTLFAKGTPAAPTGYVNQQWPLDTYKASDPFNERMALQRQSVTGVARYSSIAGGVNSFNTDATWAQNTSGRIAAKTAAGSQVASFNGGTVFISAGAAAPSTQDTVRVGVDAAGSEQWNGTISGIAIWGNTGLPNTSLQSVNINYLLRRDVEPAVNDNAPMFLEKAA